MPDETYLQDLEAHCDLLAHLLTATRGILEDLLNALDDAERPQTEAAPGHLALVRDQARWVLRQVEAADVPCPDGSQTFLATLVADYLETMDDPDRYFGPGAPDPRVIMAAATRWGVSEGRLTTPEAERLLEQIGNAPEN